MQFWCHQSRVETVFRFSVCVLSVCRLSRGFRRPGQAHSGCCGRPSYSCCHGGTHLLAVHEKFKVWENSFTFQVPAQFLLVLLLLADCALQIEGEIRICTAESEFGRIIKGKVVSFTATVCDNRLSKRFCLLLIDHIYQISDRQLRM